MWLGLNTKGHVDVRESPRGTGREHLRGVERRFSRWEGLRGHSRPVSVQVQARPITVVFDNDLQWVRSLQCHHTLHTATSAALPGFCPSQTGATCREPASPQVFEVSTLVSSTTMV